MSAAVREPLEVRAGEITSVILDVVGECNLRCVYCYQSDKNFVPHTGMTHAVLEKAIDFARAYGKSINVTAQGEFTFGKNWMEVAGRLLESGLPITCTTNLARLLDTHEVGVLSKFNTICVSIDSVDREILKSIRRSADVRTIVHNIANIRGAAIADARMPPAIVTNCVLSTGNALNIKELAAYCFAIGVQSVNVAPLHAYGDFGFDKDQLSDEKVEDPLEVWDLGLLKSLHKELSAAAEIAQKVGAVFGVSPGLAQRLLAKLNGETLSYEFGAGLTRLCTQPWDRIDIEHNGDVVPCCYGAAVVGNVAKQDFGSVVNGAKMRQLKESLLTGRGLQSACRNCAGEAIGTTEEQSARVQAYLAQG